MPTYGKAVQETFGLRHPLLFPFQIALVIRVHSVTYTMNCQCKHTAQSRLKTEDHLFQVAESCVSASHGFFDSLTVSTVQKAIK